MKKIGEKGAVESYRACFRSIDDLEKIATQIKSGCGFKKKDSLYFAALKKDVDELKKEFEARKKYDFPVEWMEADEVKNKYLIENSYGGILSHQGGSIDAYTLAHDILYYNYKRGLKIFDKTNVQHTAYKRNEVIITTEYGNTIKAKKLIYCNGFESTEIIKENFVKLLSTYAIVGEQKKEQSILNDTLFWNTADPYNYMRTTDDGRLLIGGEDEDFVNTKKRDSLLNKKAKKLEGKLKKMLPEYNFRTDFIWAGTFGETEDGLPYIGAHSNFPNTYFVLGFGGNGITFSVIGMEMISAFLKNKKHLLTSYFKFGR
ncbi:MAG: FAD-dependent oxidoreductase [Arachidicoccus sp.]|nr:FAD-dependent oxidoreductase [Arachidicoccus sp.]